jgi:hypothetical protein
LDRRSGQPPLIRTHDRGAARLARAGIRGAVGGGAHGVILSRKCSEMWLRNLAAAGAALREPGKAG